MDVLVLAIIIVLGVYSIILHEIAHGVAAEYFGDDTARTMGRITLNPIPHIDPVLTVLIPGYLLYLREVVHLSVPIFGAARPVPVNYNNLRNYRWGVFCVSIAGILTNLALAFIFSLPLRFGVPSRAAFDILYTTVLVNIVLAVINMIPIPPIDGSKVIAALIGERAIDAVSNLERRGAVTIIPLILIIIIFFQTPGFASIVEPVINFFFRIFGLS